jgi:hypothetical protein
MEKYRESRIFDEQINELVEKFPIEEHKLVWLEFCRTVKSSLNIIEEIAKEKSGINIQKPVIMVKHSELERSDESIFRSNCPECKEGILPVSRNYETFELEAEDRCLLCGQRYIYQDIEEIGK